MEVCPVKTEHLAGVRQRFIELQRLNPDTGGSLHRGVSQLTPISLNAHAHSMQDTHRIWREHTTSTQRFQPTRALDDGHLVSDAMQRYSSGEAANTRSNNSDLHPVGRS